METWDRWLEKAMAEGISAELAHLGREVMRDYVQHGLESEDRESQQLGSNGDYMLQLAKQGPVTAFHDFLAVMVWRGASGLDGEVEAFEELIRRLGSETAADEALAAEEPAVTALKSTHRHA